MTNLKQVITKLLQTNKESSQLEKQYIKKTKGRAYTARKVLLMQRQKFYENKVRAFGTTCNVIKCKYRIKNQWYKLYLTDLSLEDAKIMLSILQPAVTDANTIYEEINPGIPSTTE